ncbi:DUF2938 domain-containing protein [Dechloromonas sp. XY25]|uniref:DUF2938 domain-containing protein n=1 Tax=Dechloromonas hankyongensis TaxID=2908002 RepID=A0ABS9K477_9RHOO|nr:DUF2938 domain-containing protein [Dechloromonas hankyongensis]MCG2577941.1 DUF2938 domain-containing protein [Dechloromonas hankyongensis]
MTATQELLRIVLIGCGATLIMDLWLMFLKRIGVQTLNFAFIGRWVGHLFRGRIAHASIGKASPIAHEALLGWLTHYAVGIAFAFLLTGVAGVAWMQAPSPGIALLTGIGTVGFPLLVMQPAMGLGVAAAKTPTPFRNCIRSLLNHSVFGYGLFISACVIEWTAR